jgi:hypothetical protein
MFNSSCGKNCEEKQEMNNSFIDNFQVSYCRDHSFRSNVITYTSNNNHEAVHIQ